MIQALLTFLPHKLQTVPLRGLSDAYQTIQSVEASIDNLAHIFSRDLNELHMNGLDLEGNDGKELFHTVSIEADRKSHKPG